MPELSRKNVKKENFFEESLSKKFNFKFFSSKFHPLSARINISGVNRG